MYFFHLKMRSVLLLVELCDAAKFSLDPIPSQHRSSITNNNTDTNAFFYLEKQLLYFDDLKRATFSFTGVK